MTRTQLGILCLILTLMTSALADEKTLPYSSILSLVIEAPADAIRSRVAETETVGQKLEHFQSEVAKLNHNGQTLPIFITPKAANRIIPGQSNSGKIVEVQLRNVSVQDTMKYFCEVAGLKWQFIEQGLLIEE